MDQQTLVLVMAGAIVVSAIAIVVQAFILAGVYRANRETKERITALVAKAEPALESAQKLLEEVRTRAGEITTQTTEVLALTRKQLVRADEFLGEATARTRIQMERLELMLDDVVGRFQATAALVESGIVRPIRQVNAVVAGIRAALAVLAAARTTVEQATSDEEMFI